MRLEDARVIIEAAIKDGPDDYQEKAIGVAEWTQRMVTGKGHAEDGKVQKDWIKAVRPKETEQELQDRKHVYRSATKGACLPVRTFFSKVYRVDGISEDIQHDREKEIREAVQYFNSGADLFTFLRREQIRQEFSDPNAYLIVLKKQRFNDANIVDEVSTYPVIVPSEEIPNQKIVNGETKWIVRKQTFKVKSGHKYDVFTLYAAGIVVVYREMVDGLPPKMDDGPTVKVNVENKTYEASFYPETGTTEFPGIQWGAFRALGGMHKVSPLDPASDLLDELVKAKSILDVAIDKHVRPHRYEFVGDCNFENEDGKCSGGFINTEDGLKTCPGCQGSGMGSAKTENNVTKVKLPSYDDARELMDLSRLYHYESIDLSTVEVLAKIKDALIAAVPYSVFSSQAEATPLITRTATENLLEAENINNAVMPFAEQGSRIYELVIRVTAQYMGIYDAVVTHSFPEDLKLETLDKLLDKLGKAKANGASQEAVFSVQCEITAKTNAGNPATIANLKAFERHRPFRSMPDAVIATILLERATQDPDRRIYENWDRIKTEILEEKPGFANAEFKVQARWIEEKALEIAEKTVYSQPEETELAFNELA